MKFIPNWKEVMKYASTMWLAYSGTVLGLALFFQDQLTLIQPLAHALGAGDRIGLLIMFASALAGFLRNVDQALTKRDKK